MLSNFPKVTQLPRSQSEIQTRPSGCRAHAYSHLFFPSSPEYDASLWMMMGMTAVRMLGVVVAVEGTVTMVEEAASFCVGTCFLLEFQTHLHIPPSEQAREGG